MTCMYIYIYMHIYVYIHLFIHLYIHTYIYTAQGQRFDVTGYDDVLAPLRILGRRDSIRHHLLEAISETFLFISVYCFS